MAAERPAPVKGTVAQPGPSYGEGGPDMAPPAGYGAPAAPQPAPGPGAGPAQVGPVGVVPVYHQGERDINAVCCCTVTPQSTTMHAVVACIMAVLAVLALAAVVREGRDVYFCSNSEATYPDTNSGKLTCERECTEDCERYNNFFFVVCFAMMLGVVTGAAAALVGRARVRSSRAALQSDPSPEADAELVRQSVSVRQAYLVAGTMMGSTTIGAAYFGFAAGAAADSNDDMYEALSLATTSLIIISFPLFFITHIFKVRWRLLAGLYGPPRATASIFGLL